MSDETPKRLEVSANLEGASVTIEGQAADDAALALLDSVGFFTELGGVFKDGLRAVRQRNAIKNIKKAEDLARNLNIPVRPISPRFLLEWIDGASLVGDDEETLAKMWSALLASEGTRPNSENLYFTSLLKTMSVKEAKLFLKIYSRAEVSASVAELIDQYHRPVTELLDEKTLDELSDRDLPNFRNLDQKSIEHYGYRIGSVKIGTEAVSRELGMKYFSAQSVIKPDEEVLLQSLVSRGLLKTITAEGSTRRDIFYKLDVYARTAFGERLFESVTDRETS